MLDSKVKSALSRSLINNDNFLEVFRYKVKKLNLTSILKLTVFVFCFKGGTYQVCLRIPNVNVLLSRAMSLNKSFKRVIS